MSQTDWYETKDLIFILKLWWCSALQKKIHPKALWPGLSEVTGKFHLFIQSFQQVHCLQKAELLSVNQNHLRCLHMGTQKKRKEIHGPNITSYFCNCWFFFLFVSISLLRKDGSTSCQLKQSPLAAAAKQSYRETQPNSLAVGKVSKKQSKRDIRSAALCVKEESTTSANIFFRKRQYKNKLKPIVDYNK